MFMRNVKKNGIGFQRMKMFYITIIHDFDSSELPWLTNIVLELIKNVIQK